MINLLDTTFIIPIKIEHRDRYRNAKTVLNFLNVHFKTNVFIYEISESESKLNFLDELENLNITNWIAPSEGPFHRTKYLNRMLDEVTTPVVVNYDIDIILSPENYLECQNLILQAEADVIYPYEFGQGQYQVFGDIDLDGFYKSGYDVNFLNSSGKTIINSAECGHCIFFNTEIYKKAKGENERFISYGPEDKERMYRFINMGKKVIWREGEKVYHFEHYRGNDSWGTNPHFQENWKVFDEIKSLSPEGLMEYYESIDYSGIYKTLN